MLAKFNVKDGDHWRKANEIHIKDGEAWRSCKEIWAKKNGTWRKIFEKAIQLTIEEDTANYDLFTAAGSPDEPVEITLVVDLGVTVSSSNPALAAIYVSSAFQPGTILKLINKGAILGLNGAGGTGGDGGALDGSSPAIAGTPGGDGSDALSLGCDTFIVNESGNIWSGGGGGGGGGGGDSFVSGDVSESGAGGSGGGGWPGGLGGSLSHGGIANGPGNSGDSSKIGPAAGGAAVKNGYVDGEYAGRGGNCWGYGQGGQSGGNATPGANGGAGGAAGKAVEQNGYSLTWISGLTADQVKGAFD